MNSATITGNLTRDCVCKKTENSWWTSFTIAADARKPDGHGGWTDGADFVKCYMWGERGHKLAPYLTKGKQVGVRGPIRSSSSVEKDTGRTRNYLQVEVVDFEFLGGPGRSVSSEDSREAAGRDGAARKETRAVPAAMEAFGVQPEETDEGWEMWEDPSI